MPLAFVSMFVWVLATGCIANNGNVGSNKNDKIASIVFDAWQKGESGEGYADFVRYVNESAFEEFSHPQIGSFSGKEAWEHFRSLIESREAKPNHLRFSNVVQYRSRSGGVCFQFDSEGTVGAGFSYKGYNIIQLTIKGEKLIGFREYFGYINPAWFK